MGGSADVAGEVDPIDPGEEEAVADDIGDVESRGGDETPLVAHEPRRNATVTGSRNLQGLGPRSKNPEDAMCPSAVTLRSERVDLGGPQSRHAPAAQSMVRRSPS